MDLSLCDKQYPAIFVGFQFRFEKINACKNVSLFRLVSFRALLFKGPTRETFVCVNKGICEVACWLLFIHFSGVN